MSVISQVAGLAQKLAGERRAVLVGLLRDAVEAGELRPGADPELLADALTGPILLRRLLLMQPVGPEIGAALVDQVVPFTDR